MAPCILPLSPKHLTWVSSSPSFHCQGSQSDWGSVVPAMLVNPGFELFREWIYIIRTSSPCLWDGRPHGRPQGSQGAPRPSLLLPSGGVGKGVFAFSPVNGTWKRKQSWPLLTLLRGYRISNEASLKTGHLEPTVSSVFWLQRQVQHSVRVLGPWERQERGSKEMGICPLYHYTLTPSFLGCGVSASPDVPLSALPTPYWDLAIIFSASCHAQLQR